MERVEWIHEAGGFVLAGGQSTRMGRDKALLMLDGETLVARAVRSLATACNQVRIAGGGQQLREFAEVVPDSRPGCGPLGGIVAGLEATEMAVNLFLAVDVPFVPAEVWRGLKDFAWNSNAVAVMARVNGQVQPLCAAYKVGALTGLRRELEAGRWKVTAAAAAAGRVEYVDFEDEGWFRNVNTPEELAEAGGGR